MTMLSSSADSDDPVIADAEDYMLQAPDDLMPAFGA